MRRTLRILVVTALVLGAGGAPAFPPEDRVDLADGLMSRGLHDLAVREYLAFLREHPGHALTPRVFFRLGDAYRGQGNRAAADLFYRRVVQEFPESEDRPRAEFRRAELFVEAGQHGDAARLFEAMAVPEFPAELRVAALYFVGYCRAQIEEREAAEAAYRKLIEESPDAPHAPLARLGLADLLRATGRTEEALALYRTVARSSDAELSAEALFQQADLAFRGGDSAAAAGLFERLLRDYPDDPRATEAERTAAWAFHYDGRHASVLELTAREREVPDRERAEWLYLSANSRRLLLDTAGALADYDRLIEQDPDGPYAEAAAYEGALLALQRKEYADAVRRAGAAVLDGEHGADLHWILAEAHAGTGDTARAVQYLRRLVERFPGHARSADAGYRLGRILQQREQWAEASAALRQFASRHPEHPQSGAALLASGHALARQGDLEGALADWTRLLESAPEPSLAEEALLRRALAEIRLDRGEAALDSLRALRAAYPGSRFGTEAGYWMGVLYDRAGDPETAAAELRRVIEAGPAPDWDRRARYALAGVLQRSGSLDEAADLLQGLLATPMRDELAPELLDWLARRRIETREPVAAEAAAEALLEHPKADEAARARAGFLLGRARAERGETAAAIEALTSALAINGPRAEALDARLLLGRLLADASRWPEAEEAFQRVADEAAGPGQEMSRASGLFGLGDVAERSGDPEAAARYFMGVAILYDAPDISPEALYRAARCFTRLERAEEAAAARAEMTERYPDSPWLRRLDTPADAGE